MPAIRHTTGPQTVRSSAAPPSARPAPATHGGALAAAVATTAAAPSPTPGTASALAGAAVAAAGRLRPRVSIAPATVVVDAEAPPAPIAAVREPEPIAPRAHAVPATAVERPAPTRRTLLVRDAHERTAPTMSHDAYNDHRERLRGQTLDLGARGSGNRAARRLAAVREAQARPPMHAPEPPQPGPRMTLPEVEAPSRRLAEQTQDLAPRGKGSKAQRRREAMHTARNARVIEVPRLARKGAPPRGGKTVSKVQQRWAFATHQPWAHAAARRGAAYDSLPYRKGAPSARTAR